MELIIFCVIGILSRFLPHPANMTAIGATALFAGARFGLKKGLFITFLTMIVTDMVLGMHPVMWATYGSLFVTVLLGYRFASVHSVKGVLTMTLASSVIFFVITNFAVWCIPNGMYPKSVSGLIECYIMALPFFRNSLLGDIMYSGIFFGVYEYVAQWKSIRANVNGEKQRI